MKKPIIAVIPLVDETRESYWMLPGYFHGVEEAGGIPVMLPLTSDPAALEQLSEQFDGFLFTGGHDISPACYGKEKKPYCRACCPERDSMESILLPLVLAQGKAILGICRGLQFINAAMGGTLYQDLPIEHPSPVIHSQQPPYCQPSHCVTIDPIAPLFALTGSQSAFVNSCHHQGIEKLAPGLRAMAWAEDGLVEAIWKPDTRFTWAVQWHPEFSQTVDPLSKSIFRAFVTGAAQ